MRLAPALLLACLLAGCARAPAPLRVCADPNNLPFSNERREGFENRIIELVAADLKRSVRYVWWAQRRGAVRQTVGKDLCDLWPGVAKGVESLATTQPYYRSGYVFVTRSGSALAGLTLDDRRLRTARLGVQMIGDDGANTPPADALARRGIIDNVRGFPVYGDYREANPPAAIVKAVADGSLDVALAWGPLAGYWAARQKVPLRVEPIAPSPDQGRWPMAFAIAIGVRKDDPALLSQIDAAMIRQRPAIDAVLADYAVPRM